MSPSSLRAFRASAFFGLVGVALGAFGAHGMDKIFALHPKAAHWWETGVFYHLLHTVVLLLTACLHPFPALAWRLFAAGIVIFSGSLYLLTFTRVLWLGAVTPLGGVCFLGGWLLLGTRFAAAGQAPQN